MVLKEGATGFEKTQHQLTCKHAPSSGEILNYNFDLPIKGPPESPGHAFTPPSLNPAQTKFVVTIEVILTSLWGSCRFGRIYVN